MSDTPGMDVGLKNTVMRNGPNDACRLSLGMIRLDAAH